MLTLLLEQPGEVVSREELREKLWSGDTFVDFEHSLGTAVKKIRQTLSDSAASPRFVETLPKRGYRFLASVERLDDPHELTTSPQPGGSEGHPAGSAPSGAIDVLRVRRQRNLALLALPAVALAILALGLWRNDRDIRVVRFAFAPSLNIQDPVVSPDGKRIAFVSREDEGSLWIRDLHRSEPRRVAKTEGAPPALLVAG